MLIKNLINKLPLKFNSIRASTSSAAVMNNIINKFQLPDRYKDSSPSVWVEYIQLALDYKPLNLGQGFPDFPPPAYITEALSNIGKSDNSLVHQYTRGFGHPRLVAALSKLYSKLIGREINAQSEILVTVGAYEALFAAIFGHVDHGDEVIIIEPFFDCYEPMVKCAGGVPRFVPLRPKETAHCMTSNDWVLDKSELEGLFNEKTKMLILNTPNNPLGKVFNLEELQMIAELCKKWNVLCVSDEVYEWMVFDSNEHIRIASLPGMWERTLTIGSAGKTFSVTGWKIGWVYGPANLITNLQMVHQNCVYTSCTPIQEAIAQGFEYELSRFGEDDCYFISIKKELVEKRNYMSQMLIDVGMKPIIPDGGYFLVADWSPLASKIDLSSENDKYRDYRFTKWMTKNVGLQGIPPSAFYSKEHKPLAENYVRYCFMKTDKVLKDAEGILKNWNNKN